MCKKIAVLDLTGCKYLDELHERIKKALHFPNYYGKNWDAFWDCIHIDSDVDVVKIVGESKVAKVLEPEIEIMHELLEKNKQYWCARDWYFDYEIVD